ncbi:MAG: 5-formyltetrahydrofolate cyclo-ligase [Candidatus Rokubacteria bacterium]|nr:5-formyltetrahydrofolate cyclo-ligase [Candidatus Rokubacteria bacterium]
MSKQDLREATWRLLEVYQAARFPGAKGRIPNFVGAERAALALAALSVWKRARVIKVNPDAPQIPVRRMALREGKIVYMAVPRLRVEECFIELDPSRLGKNLARASTIGGADRFGTPVRVDEVKPLDLIVCGSVAVNGQGARVGKGGGYSDLEFGLLREVGAVSGRTPILTTVHPLQIVPQPIEMLPHDISVDWIVTPDGPLRCGASHPKPRGIYWECLSEEQIAVIPVLGPLRSDGTR